MDIRTNVTVQFLPPLSVTKFLPFSVDQDGNGRLAACRNKGGDHLVNLAAMIAQNKHELNYLDPSSHLEAEENLLPQCLCSRR